MPLLLIWYQSFNNLSHSAQEGLYTDKGGSDLESRDVCN